MSIVMFGALIILIAIGVPIALSLTGATLAALFTTDVSFLVVVQRFFTSMDSFSLMAIPFFMMAGLLMERGGISKRLINLANLLLGNMYGGLAIVLIIVSAFFVFYFCAADIPKVYRYSCYYWLPVSLVILIFALQRGYISRLLSNRGLVIGGEISYSFYLIHLFIILTYLQMATLYQWHIHWMISVPVIFCITIALSLLSYYYFEKPANRWVKRILTKKTIIN